MTVFFRQTLIFFFIFLSGFLGAISSLASKDGYVVELKKISFHVHEDYTYDSIEELKIRITSFAGAQGINQWDYLYWPQSETFELLEAHVQQPDGTKEKVDEDQVFIRPSKASEEAPGFVNSQTATVVLPNVQEGSIIYLKTKQSRIKPTPYKFNLLTGETFSEMKKLEVSIDAPKDLYLKWDKIKNLPVTETFTKNRRHITFSLKNVPRKEPEPHMLKPRDFMPLFVVSSLKNWEALGQIYYQQHKPKIIIDETIKKLSQKIVGDKKGFEAVKAIYYWTSKNIRYLAVYLDPQRGYEPNTPQEILKHGYGDCKDQTALMHALMLAQGIEAYPALIYAGESFITLPLPIPQQFNHAILYVPAYDVFLDATDPFQTFGGLSDTLENKITVLGTKEGAVKYTPKNKPTDKQYSIYTTAYLSADGTMTGQSSLTFKGKNSSSPRRIFLADNKEQLANHLLAKTQQGGTGTLSTSDPFDLDQPFKVKGTWVSPQAMDSGTIMNFKTPMGLGYVSLSSLKKLILLPKRLYPFAFTMYDSYFTYRINLPKGYKALHLPKNKHIKNHEGSFKSTYEDKRSHVLIKRDFVVYNVIHTPKYYPDLLELFRAANADENAIITIEKEKRG